MAVFLAARCVFKIFVLCLGGPSRRAARWLLCGPVLYVRVRERKSDRQEDRGRKILRIVDTPVWSLSECVMTGGSMCVWESVCLQCFYVN